MNFSYFVILSISFISALTDLYNKKIYNIVLTFGFVIVLSYFLYSKSLVFIFHQLLNGSLLVLIFMYPFLKKWIGGGDIKLLALIAFSLKSSQIISIFLYIFIIGGIFALIFKNKLPYAPAIFCGVLLYLLHPFAIF